MKCFVIAMEKEAAPVCEALSDWNFGIKLKNSMSVKEGVLYGEDVVILVCGVGKVNAAMGTQYLIDRYNPETIVNIGVAGGLCSSVEVGGIYGVSGVVQFDFDLTQLNGGVRGTLDGRDDPMFHINVAQGFESRIAGTADRFNDDPNDYELLRLCFGAEIRDMELGAIAQVCEENGVSCYSFKIISDIAGNGSTTEQYLKNLEICFETLKANLEKIIKSLPKDQRENKLQRPFASEHRVW